MSELPSNHPVNMLINQYQRKVDTSAGLSPEEYQHMVLCINEYNTKLLSTPQGQQGQVALYPVPDPKCIKIPPPPAPPPAPAPAPEKPKEEAKKETPKEEPKKEEAKAEEKKEEPKKEAPKEEPKKEEAKAEEKKEEPKKEEAAPAPAPEAAPVAAASGVSSLKDGITVLLAIVAIFILAKIMN